MLGLSVSPDEALASPWLAARAAHGGRLKATSAWDAHLITYLHLLDADAAEAKWREVTRIVLGIEQEREPVRT